MKKFVLTLVLVLLSSVAGFSQANLVLNKNYGFNSATNSTAEDVKSKGIGFYKIVWANYGISAPSACTVQLQSSPDNVNFTTVTTNTCTSDGQSSWVALSTSFIRVNISAYTPLVSNALLNINIQGAIELPVQGGAVQMLWQPSQTSGVTATTVTRATFSGLSQFKNCYVLLNVTAGGTATGTLQIWIEDSSDGGTTYEDLISSLTFALGAAVTTQRFSISGTILGATITTAASTNITQGATPATETLAAGSARQGPFGDRIRIREKITSPSGSPVGATYNIQATCKP